MLMLMIQTMEHEAAANHRNLDRLLTNVAAGEQDALEKLYHSARPAVYAMALTILKNPHDAQDVAQDAFVQIWENASRYRSLGSPMAWILTITRNLAYMKLRQGSRHTELDEQQWAAIPMDAPGITTEDRYLLQEALAILSDEERRIIVLHAVSGLKHREIAELLELPLATVLSKYHRALKKLKVFIERS